MIAGFGHLRCPCCSSISGIWVDLAELKEFGCQDCEDTFTRGEVEAMIAESIEWRDVLAWLDTRKGGAS